MELAKCDKGAEHRTENTYTGRGRHHTYFIDGGKIGVGTPHNIEKKNAEMMG